MILKELAPGDIVLSYKKPDAWNLPGRFFNWKVKRHALNVFGEDCVFPECNHVRIIVGIVGGHTWGFHWTAPTAQFFKAEEWLVDPAYSMVMRDKRGPLDTSALMNACVDHDGSVYDIGDLIDVGFHLPFSLDFGKNNYFCSAGVLMIREFMGRHDPCKTSVERVPPCNWANYPEYFDCVNSVNSVRGIILPEPIQHETIRRMR